MSDIRRANGPHAWGYTEIAGIDGPERMAFGVLRLRRNEVFRDDAELEKAFLLVYGSVRVEADGKEAVFTREDCFNTGPYALHTDATTGVRITVLSDDSEICVMRTANATPFPVQWFKPEDTPDEYRGAGLMKETSTRIVRTIFDKRNAPDANLVLGEVIGFPGKWSSYPPHHHPQPEIYYYKTNPEHGFGYAELGDQVLKVRNNDAVSIPPGLTHPQCAAPGYALWYLWAIRHLEDQPYIQPVFVPEHLWVLEKDVRIWPERKDAE